MHRYFRLTIFVLLAFSTLFSIQAANSGPDLSSIKLPKGFKIGVFANQQTKGGDYLSGARFMTLDSAGNLYVSSAKGNSVVMLPDNNKDGIADDVVLVAKNLNAPQGLVFVGDKLLVANQDGVVTLTKVNGKWPAKVSPFINGLATGGHTLKNIKLSPDGYLFINVGSSCNVCNESDPTRATILRYTLEGKPAGSLLTLGRHQQSAVWAHGLRNSQGFAWHPQTTAMYATNNGSDMRSDTKGGKVNDELPPEHLNKIEAGKHYGWPYCWGDPINLNSQVQDPNFVGEPGFCKTTQAPAITITSHSTPIGITFLDKSNFPSDYKNDAILALHGSWNREQPSGYKLVRVKFKREGDDVRPSEVEDFATGWLQGDNAWGRPVDVTVGTDKALYVSDDKSGLIYRITYQAK
ncbi:MAG TPA: PQQ-dependent sugar dehydrogenase [Methylotenera sp.]|nr:PQQ-dependent sugar dehydrogenase [Methylotenera sp.]